MPTARDLFSKRSRSLVNRAYRSLPTRKARIPPLLSLALLLLGPLWEFWLGFNELISISKQCEQKKSGER
jgi:hypothetical protein